MAPPSHGLSKLLTFALHLILVFFRQLGCDLIQEAPALELLLVGGGALSIEEALHRLAQPLQLLLVKDPFPGHQAGAEGEVLPGALIVLHVVVAVVDPGHSPGPR